MKHFFYCIIIGWLSASAQAQPAWTLRNCIEYGLANNKTNKIYANDKKEADAKAREALAGYLPGVSVTGDLDDNLKLEQSVIPAGIFGPKPLKISLTEKYNTTLVAEVDQTIFDQSLLTGLKANRYNKEQADLNFRQNQEAIIYNISKAYYQIFIYREQLAMLNSNLETYQRQMNISGIKVRKGVMLESDLDKVTVNYNNTRSQTSVAESNLVVAENQLKNDMGLPAKADLQVDSLWLQTIFGQALERNSVVFLAKNRTDYALALVNEKLLAIDQKSIHAEMYPKLTAYARYGGVGFGNTLSPAINDLNAFSVVGLKLTIPLFDFKRTARYKEAEYEHSNAAEDIKIDEDNFRLDFENARTKLEKAQSDIENDQRNIGLAQSVFQTTDLQYQKGVTDLTDWLNARLSLKEAQNNYLSSLYTFYLSRIDLEQANGTLFNYYKTL